MADPLIVVPDDFPSVFDKTAAHTRCQQLGETRVGGNDVRAAAVAFDAERDDRRMFEEEELIRDLAGFPPSILISGTRDLLLSLTVRTHRKLRASGVDAELQRADIFGQPGPLAPGIEVSQS